MDDPVHPAVFNPSELWLLNSALPSWLAPGSGDGRLPTFEDLLDLKEKIADALIFCDRLQQAEATVRLNERQVILIDACVSPSLVDPRTYAEIGRTTLLKTFYAWKGIRLGTTTLPSWEMSPEERAYQLEHIAFRGAFKQSPAALVVNSMDDLVRLFSGMPEKGEDEQEGSGPSDAGPGDELGGDRESPGGSSFYGS